MRPRGSVVIPAHDEATVIGRCLEASTPSSARAAHVVVVACNGCTRRHRRRGPGVRRPRGPRDRPRSKTAALNLGDEVADDLSAALRRCRRRTARRLGGRAGRPAVDRAQPSRPVPPYLNVPRRQGLVRSYYRARAPVLRSGLALGRRRLRTLDRGTGRFEEFPDVIADDLFVDRLFRRDEIEIVDADPVVVHTPRDVRNLINVLRRAQRGKGELAGHAVDERDERLPRPRRRARDLIRTGLTGPCRRSTPWCMRRMAAAARAGTAAGYDAAMGAGCLDPPRLNLATAPVPAAGSGGRPRQSPRRRSWSRSTSITLFVFPTDLVYKPIGAQAFVAGLVSLRSSSPG